MYLRWTNMTLNTCMVIIIIFLFICSWSYESLELIIMSFNYRVSWRIFRPLLQWIMPLPFIWKILSSSVYVWDNGMSLYNRVFSKENYRFAYRSIDTKYIFLECVLKPLFPSILQKEIINRIYDFKICL